ncbi:OmcA/MtrC family decaheme c-type cytochrome [Shewanella intestini]|uniref:OmcA/MtrC family decaheme c-type cytochrome n=1 Tax=Shewanella intestini TaxID=2017544 RepID=A0ABS5I6A6_9GAMM|nr:MULTISPECIES: OmcA/MtrC family decaheme c-type cytochrome [Shewanella]MBR9729552.1 OmcA/MtrC family decaheme c-type cytochrome [Shewanella intestini]MRG35452.1 OmcA/MtrC family decaheme c-type cytochrome [Shewanella sp. XMDDZSB0408]
MMMTKYTKIAMFIAASSFALAGCGSDGKDGTDGLPSVDPAKSINDLHLDVTNVTYNDGVPTIEVFATNEDDKPVVGLSDLGIVIAQLTPAHASGAGNSAQWTRTARESGPDAFVDHKTGAYTFTIKPEGFNAQLTQRYNVYAGGKDSTLLDGKTAVPRQEIVKDFDGEGYKAKYTKNIVSHEVCAKCHNDSEPLTRRHSSYYKEETCATCHSSSMSPDKQWNHLIHNIHNTNKTFEDKYGNEYDGEAAQHLIQNNCQSCHVEKEGLGEWQNWTQMPTMETCSSCHVNVDFVNGQGHPKQTDNSNCIACHSATWTEEIHTGKANSTNALINQYGLHVASTIDATTQAATISIQVVNAEGEQVDINTLSSMIQRIEVVTNVGPNKVTLGYNGKDYINAIKNGVIDPKAKIEDGKLIYTTSKDLNLGAQGKDDETAFTFVGWGMCSEDGKFVNCTDPDFDGNDLTKYTSMKADMAFATLSGDAPSMRHVDSVNFTACASCHSAGFPVHKGGHHVGFVMTEQLSHSQDENGQPIIGVDACTACHTPDGTYAGGANMGALEMKLHKEHSQGDYAVVKGMNCSQCHTTFNLDAFKVKGAMATDAGKYSTPIAATCASCHSHNLDAFKAHVETQGAIVNGDDKQAVDDAAQLETCFFCHAPTPADHTSMKF